MLLAVALLFVACGVGAIEPKRPELGHSSSTAADEDEDEDEDDSETAPPTSTKDAAIKQVSTPASAQGSKDAGARTTPVDTSAAPSTATATAVESGFDAGAGTLLADGKTVEYHIPEGTGRKDWNPKDKPIKVAPGMTLRLIDDDTTAAGGGHWLHTFGQPCAHGTRPIGKGFDCKIRVDAPTGLVEGTFEHNSANAGGRIYIVVVKGNAPSEGTSTLR